MHNYKKKHHVENNAPERTWHNTDLPHQVYWVKITLEKPDTIVSPCTNRDMTFAYIGHVIRFGKTSKASNLPMNKLCNLGAVPNSLAQAVLEQCKTKLAEKDEEALQALEALEPLGTDGSRNGFIAPVLHSLA